MKKSHSSPKGKFAAQQYQPATLKTVCSFTIRTRSIILFIKAHQDFRLFDASLKQLLKHPTSIIMKSICKSLILTIIALLAGSNLRGETVLVTQISGVPCNALHILTVYQRGSEVLVSKHLEIVGVGCIQSVARVEAALEMEYPSIALTETEFFIPNNGNWQVLYRNGVFENSYNPDWGDGWVDTLAAGYVNIKRYPWIFHPDLGWLKVTEGDIVVMNTRNVLAPKALGFYLYSAEYGWLWTTEFTKKFFSFTDMKFKSIEEITGG